MLSTFIEHLGQLDIWSLAPYKILRNLRIMDDYTNWEWKCQNVSYVVRAGRINIGCIGGFNLLLIRCFFFTPLDQYQNINILIYIRKFAKEMSSWQSIRYLTGYCILFLSQLYIMNWVNKLLTLQISLNNWVHILRMAARVSYKNRRENRHFRLLLKIDMKCFKKDL